MQKDNKAWCYKRGIDAKGITDREAPVNSVIVASTGWLHVILLLKAYSFGHLLKTVELVKDQMLFFGYPSTENGRLRRLQIAFIKAHSFGHSVFSRYPRDFWSILLGSSVNGRDPRFRKPSAPEAGKLLKDCREHCFVNEKVFKNIRKNNETSQILFSCDWHTKSTLQCNGFNSLGRTTTFEFSFFQDSHSFGIFLC